MQKKYFFAKKNELRKEVGLTPLVNYRKLKESGGSLL